MDDPIAAQRFGAGPPLVLVHGDFNTGMMAWRRQVGHHANLTLLVTDRRGYGASPALDAPHAIAADAEDVLLAARFAGFPAFDLAGHSFGGLVAIEMAAIAPDRIRSLVLVEPPMLSLLPDHPDVARLRDRTAAVWAAAAGTTDEELASAFFGAIAGPDGVARMRESRGWPDLVREARRGVRGQPPDAFPASRLDDLRPDLPLAVLTGGRSHAGLRAVAEEIARRLPGSTFVVAPRHGHAAQFDRLAFAAALASVADPVPDPDPGLAAPRPPHSP